LQFSSLVPHPYASHASSRFGMNQILFFMPGKDIASSSEGWYAATSASNSTLFHIVPTKLSKGVLTGKKPLWSSLAKVPMQRVGSCVVRH